MLNFKHRRTESQTKSQKCTFNGLIHHLPDICSSFFLRTKRAFFDGHSFVSLLPEVCTKLSNNKSIFCDNISGYQTSPVLVQAFATQFCVQILFSVSIFGTQLEVGYQHPYFIRGLEGTSNFREIELDTLNYITLTLTIRRKVRKNCTQLMERGHLLLQFLLFWSLSYSN